MKRLSPAFAVCALACLPAAAGNLLTNGSFENTNNTFVNSGDGGMLLNNGSTAIPGWTVVTPGPSTNVAWVTVPNPYNEGTGTVDGSFDVDLTGYSDASPFGGVEQTITTTAGANYSLTYLLMEIAGDSLFGGPVSVIASAGATTSTCSYNPPGSGNMATVCMLNFTAAGTSTLIQLQGSVGNEFIGVDKADVELVATPEPGFAMPLFCCFGLAFLGRRHITSRMRHFR